MFGLIRTLILIAIAFIGGLMFERNQASALCTTEGGTQVKGICRGVSQ